MRVSIPFANRGPAVGCEEICSMERSPMWRWHLDDMVVWVVVSNMFYFHPENWGRWTHFDEHIFQMGWFNHQLVVGVLSVFLGNKNLHYFLKKMDGYPNFLSKMWIFLQSIRIYWQVNLRIAKHMQTWLGYTCCILKNTYKNPWDATVTLRILTTNPWFCQASVVTGQDLGIGRNVNLRFSFLSRDVLKSIQIHREFNQVFFSNRFLLGEIKWSTLNQFESNFSMVQSMIP